MIKTKIITRPKYENYEFEFDIERFSNQLNRKIIDIQYTSSNSNYEAIITYEI
ncbi:hypothetical protein SD942_01295 [Lactobacillus paragasseri]|jgi:hypothetical protein|uniref:Phage protein n=1 Tax=Lactobacillus paragasseri TaxID=2107999 RepID=A0ABD4ZI92_9LACO|nr:MULTISPECIES: hypothetical protein [Lactobacillus]MDK7297793.1 hypothetical protein [Lactobacillus paragasseri]MDX5071215.1 hypothetical protein [Lactobacillus paragasseri]MDX5086400.1 hypothetical protein [Lactobacillus paragasseri]DAT71622.1 MAG TPA: hypothetical protein [Caudoviricetes sp.]